jgi:hypothetical protein
MTFKYLVLPVLLLLTSLSFAQKDTTAILERITRLEEALVSKQRTDVSNSLHADVAFEHSNGWVQNKIDVLKDMESGYLVYKAYNRESISIEIKKKKAFVREVVNVEGTRNKVDFKMKLFVSQLWVETKKGWMLLFRQSTKL